MSDEPEAGSRPRGTRRRRADDRRTRDDILAATAGLLRGERPLTMRSVAEAVRDRVPPAMLAGILGIHPTTAVKWTRLAGGNWTSYAADRTSSK